MISKTNLNNFIDKMKETVYKAGGMALEHQGKVKNLEKGAEELFGDNDFIRQQRAAKTIIDDKVQEELLLAASKLLPASEVYLDAEEETPGKKCFSAEPKSTALVIDPIDGTLLYVSGKDGFSVCVGLIEDGAILTSLVYFPARQEFYFIKNGDVYCETNGKLRELFAPKVRNESLVYVNNRIGKQTANKLVKGGFKVINDADGLVSWPDALIGCVKGEYNACIFHTPQIRDVLVGAVISKMSGGFACDWLGSKIIWPNGGRIPRIIFGFSPISEKVLSCLEV